MSSPRATLTCVKPIPPTTNLVRRYSSFYHQSFDRSGPCTRATRRSQSTTQHRGISGIFSACTRCNTWQSTTQAGGAP